MPQLFSHEAIHLQVRSLVGSKVWKDVFEECRFKAAEGIMVIITPTVFAAKQDLQNYRALLESDFCIAVRVEARPRRNPHKLSLNAKLVVY
jgi:hypothetical protein